MLGDTVSHVWCVLLAGRSVNLSIQPIPVGGPFHRVGVDVLQLPLTEAGNRYVEMFLDYLTKWVEAFRSLISVQKRLPVFWSRRSFVVTGHQHISFLIVVPTF